MKKQSYYIKAKTLVVNEFIKQYLQRKDLFDCYYIKYSFAPMQQILSIKTKPMSKLEFGLMKMAILSKNMVFELDIYESMH